MHFTLTAIDREGKEWGVETFISLSKDKMMIYVCLDKYDELGWDRAILRPGSPNNRYIVAEWSTPSELEAWRKKCRTKS